MITLRGIVQPSDHCLAHMLLAYWRKLLFTNFVERLSEKGYEQRSEREFGGVGRQKWTEK